MRVFDKQTKFELTAILKRTIEALRKDMVWSPEDIGIVAGMLREACSYDVDDRTAFGCGLAGDCDFTERQDHYFQTGEIIPEGEESPRRV